MSPDRRERRVSPDPKEKRVSLAPKATRAIVARRDLQDLQDQPVLLVQVHQQRRKSRRHHLVLEHRDLVNPRGTASRRRVDRWQHPPIPRLLDFLLEAAREYGPLTSFRLGPRHVSWQAHPIRMPSTTSSTSEPEPTSPVLGNGLVTSEGEFWRRQRNPGATSIRCPKVGSASLFHLRDCVHM